MFDCTIYPKIKEYLKQYPVVVVTGARRVGKSTEVYKLVKDCGFFYDARCYTIPCWKSMYINDDAIKCR